MGLCVGSRGFFKQEVSGGQQQRGWHRELYRNSPFPENLWTRMQGLKDSKTESWVLKIPSYLTSIDFNSFSPWSVGPSCEERYKVQAAHGAGLHFLTCLSVPGSAGLIPTLRCCFIKYRWRLYLEVGVLSLASKDLQWILQKGLGFKQNLKLKLKGKAPYKSQV